MQLRSGLLFFPLVLSLVMHSSGSGLAAQELFHLSVRPEAPVLLPGAPLRAVLEISNVSNDRTFLIFDSHGFPEGVRLEIQGTAGHSSLHVHKEHLHEPPSPVSPSDLYVMERGEVVRLTYDLSDEFHLESSGAYEIIAYLDNTPAARAAVTVADINVARELAIQEYCAHSPLRKNLDEGVIAVSCTLQLISVPSQSHNRHLLRLSGLEVGREHPFPLYLELPVAAGTRILKAELDFRWRVWTLLEAGGTQCLVLWDIPGGATHTLIDWTERSISLGSGPAKPSVRARIVIAGIPGEAFHSSLSVGR